MRRQNVQLIALARQGDPIARIEVGRRYLLGIEGFTRHVQTGIDYLTHPSLRHNEQAARIVGESLSLQEIVQLDALPLLAFAARTDSAECKFKQGLWTLAVGRDESEARKLVSAAAAAGHEAAQRALNAMQHSDAPDSSLQRVLLALGADTGIDAQAIALMAARSAIDASDLPHLLDALAAGTGLQPKGNIELDDLVVQATRLAATQQGQMNRLSPEIVEASLDRRAHQGDSWAAFALGRALCGIDVDGLAAGDLAAAAALRRGTALLFRAADAGWTEAWLHLYRLHADQKLPIANAQLARFCLEKAAHVGNRQAQTKLGALMLKSSGGLAETEQAISWLHKAATEGDDHALELLSSLHLPLRGSAAEARSAIEEVRRDYPWLALRMQLSRDFGLTKLEALCVDVADGLRPWGLVVGKNPFIVQSRLSAPRAIPALTVAALDNLRRTAMLLADSGGDGYALEGNARRRSLLQRRAFERLGLDEAMFFAKASTNELDTLRQGPRWAFRAKAQLQMALAA
jgi:TPR repeat protein